MTTTAAAHALRTAMLIAVIGAAVAVGLIVGALSDARQRNAGYPIGWQPGPGAPVSLVADAAFSLEALDAVRAARGDAAQAQGTDEDEAESDYHQRHPEQTRSNRIPDFVE